MKKTQRRHSGARYNKYQTAKLRAVARVKASIRRHEQRMLTFRDRQLNRVARWRRVFPRFVHLNQSLMAILWTQIAALFGGGTHNASRIARISATGDGGLEFNIESLEQRQLLAGVIVDNSLDVVNGDTSSIGALIANDGNDGISLREAVQAANNTAGANTISFEQDSTFNISLSSGELTITNAVTIDGSDAADVTIDGDSSTRIFNVSDSNAATTLRSLTITNGTQGVYSAADLTVESTTISNNTSDDSGAGVDMSSLVQRSLTITDSTISGNSTAKAGGGVLVFGYVDVLIEDSIISGNSTGNYGNFYGGGIIANLNASSANGFGSLSISSSQINNNVGGGISTNLGLTLTSSVVSGNTGARGGIRDTGFYYGPDNCDDGCSYVLIQDSTVSDNVASASAGGGVATYGKLTVINSTLSGNSAENGGAIHAINYDSNIATVINSTISGNFAQESGGGLYVNNLALINSTISGNSASIGGGLHVLNYYPQLIVNSIVTGNYSSSPIEGHDIYGSVSFDGGNIVGSSFDISGQSNVQHGDAVDVFENTTATLIGVAQTETSILSGVLADNGGSVETVALLSGSDAIDSGDSSLLPADEYDLDGDGDLVESLPVDSRGEARVTGTAVDLGAYELGSVLALTVDSTNVQLNEGDLASNGGSVEGSGVSLTASVGTVTDNGDETWSWSLNTTDGPDNSGTVTITATDEGGINVAETFSLIVNNVAPIVGVDAATVTVDEGDDATNFGTFGDAGDDVVTLSASVGTVTDNGDGTWSWSLSTTDGPDNSTSVTITATDDDGESTDAAFSLQVNNVAPTVAVDAATVTVDEGDDATNSGTFGDAGDDVVTLSASIGTVTDNGDGTWSWSLSTSDGPDDSTSVTITATDEDGDTASESFAIQVNNVAPVLGVDNPFITVDAGDIATTSGVISDTGDDSVMLGASIGTITDNGDGTWSWSLGTDGPGDSAPVNITAVDEDGALSIATFFLTVNNVAPVVDADSAIVTVAEGNNAVNSGTVSDTGNDTVMLSASAGTVTDNGDGTWSWLLANATAADAQTVTITAEDSNGGLSSTSFDVSVTPPLVLDSLTFGSLANVGSGTTFEAVANGNGVTYGWDFGDGSATETGGTVSHAFGTAGEFTVTLTINDAAGATLVETFVVQVTDLAIKVKNDNLTVTGTGDDDIVEITSNGSSIVVNGVDTGIADDSLQVLKVSTKKGLDDVRLGGAETLIVNKTLKIATSADDDSVVIDNVQIVGKSKIATSGGNDVVTIGNSTFDDKLSVATGGGDDLLFHDFATVNYGTTFSLNGGGGFDLITEYFTDPSNGSIKFDGFIE
jgi:hypothetical protein